MRMAPAALRGRPTSCPSIAVDCAQHSTGVMTRVQWSRSGVRRRLETGAFGRKRGFLARFGREPMRSNAAIENSIPLPGTYAPHRFEKRVEIKFVHESPLPLYRPASPAARVAHNS